MKKKIKYFLIILFGICMEFLRDYCFININLQIEYLENLESNLNVFNYTDSKNSFYFFFFKIYVDKIYN